MDHHARALPDSWWDGPAHQGGVVGRCDKCAAGRLTVWVTCLAVILVAMGGLVAWQTITIVQLGQRVEKLEVHALFNLEETDSWILDPETAYSRNRRNAESPYQLTTSNPLHSNTQFRSQDGIPILARKYKDIGQAGDPDALGFRVYNSWFKYKREKDIKGDPRVVWAGPTDSPIRPYHRKSAAWVENQDSSDNSDGDFMKFGNSLYSDSAKIKTNAHINSVNLAHNRAKITNFKEYQNTNFGKQNATTGSRDQLSVTTTTTVSPSRTPIGLARGREHEQSWRSRAARNRAALKAGKASRRHRQGARSGVNQSHGISGLIGVHYEADMPLFTENRESIQKVGDGIFRDWTLARWAKRLKLDSQFILADGKVTVPASGVYYVYAQINYLDEHDVNGFQISVNNNPFVTCTKMTHTPQLTTKVNTCYTGGVIFIEQGDTVHVQNMEQNRFAVMLSTHSFFGLIQLSTA